MTQEQPGPEQLVEQDGAQAQALAEQGHAREYDDAYDDTYDDLQDETDELPRRPRRRVLAPLPVALALVLVTACGFIGGVLVQKGQSSSTGTSGAATGLASRLRGLGGRAAATGGSARALGGAGATVGQVSFVSGDTLYVTDTEGNTVKVLTSRASQVTKTVKSSTKAIRPGETVIVTGASAGGGAVQAEAIRVSEAGSGGGLTGLFGGGSGAGGSPGATGGSGGGGAGGASGGPALFGAG